MLDASAPRPFPSPHHTFHTPPSCVYVPVNSASFHFISISSHLKPNPNPFFSSRTRTLFSSTKHERKKTHESAQNRRRPRSLHTLDPTIIISQTILFRLIYPKTTTKNPLHPVPHSTHACFAMDFNISLQCHLFSQQTRNTRTTGQKDKRQKRACVEQLK